MNDMNIDSIEINIEDIKVDITNDDDGDESKEVMCDECSIVVDNKKLMKHKEFAHKEYMCSECGHVVVGKQKLKDHKKSHKKGSCVVCKKEFQLKNLSSHIQLCSKKASKGKKHTCETCGYAAPNRKRLFPSQCFLPYLFN